MVARFIEEDSFPIAARRPVGSKLFMDHIWVTAASRAKPDKKRKERFLFRPSKQLLLLVVELCWLPNGIAVGVAMVNLVSAPLAY